MRSRTKQLISILHFLRGALALLNVTLTDAKTLDEAKAKIEDRTINGIPVKLLELAGRYQGMGQAAPRPGMMQLGAIIQAPGRTVFVRLVGQLETVEGARKEFEALVNGVRASE